MRRQLPSPFDARPRYGVTVEDRFWLGIYLPIGVGIQTVAGWVGRLQQGRISVYLLYSFLTLITLLVIAI
jgi:hypothetical protein